MYQMELQLNNVIWPLMIMGSSLFRCAYLIIITIGIEALPLIYFFQRNVKSALILSSISNIISATVGLIVPYFIYGVFYFSMSRKAKKRFPLSTWMIITFIVFCLGSILIELLAVYFMEDHGFTELILPLSMGNIVSYLLTYLINKKYIQESVEDMK